MAALLQCVKIQECKATKQFQNKISFEDGQVVGRGCSDKGKNFLFEDHCETFKSKEKVREIHLDS